MGEETYRVTYTKAFSKEMKELKETHPKVKKYLDSGAFRNIINLLELDGPSYHTGGNIKKIKGTNNLYEIRVMLSRPAIRLLFTYDDYNIVFLHFFQKQDNSDYNHACEVANRRFKRWKGRDENE